MYNRIAINKPRLIYNQGKQIKTFPWLICVYILYVKSEANIELLQYVVFIKCVHPWYVVFKGQASCKV